MDSPTLNFVTSYWFTTILFFTILFVILTPIVLICLCGVRFFLNERNTVKDSVEQGNFETQNIYSICEITEMKMDRNQNMNNDVRYYFE